MDVTKEAMKLTFDRDLVREISALVERAVTRERDRCLRIVEDRRDYSMGHDLGKAIDLAVDVAADMIRKGDESTKR